MGNLLKIFKVPERSKIENITGPGRGTYQDVEQTIPGGEKRFEETGKGKIRLYRNFIL